MQMEVQRRLNDQLEVFLFQLLLELENNIYMLINVVIRVYNYNVGSKEFET